jgi:hypothetical protein
MTSQTQEIKIDESEPEYRYTYAKYVCCSDVITSIYEFTNELLKRKNLAIDGTIKYLCCPNPYKHQFFEGNDSTARFKVFLFQAVYINKDVQIVIKSQELIKLMKNLAFIATNTKKRMLTEKGNKNGFIIRVTLKKEECNGHPFFNYKFEDDVPEKLVTTLAAFREKLTKVKYQKIIDEAEQSC